MIGKCRAHTIAYNGIARNPSVAKSAVKHSGPTGRPQRPGPQASLGVSAPKAARCALKVKVGDGEPLVVCCLREAGTESLVLDLIFDAYAEFSVEGPASIHLTGYFMPEYGVGEWWG